MGKDIQGKILYEAMNEMDKYGLNFRMDDLAHRLNISKRTLYENFSSKQEIVQQVIFLIMDDLYEQHKQILEDSRLTAEEKLGAYFAIRVRNGKVFLSKTAISIFKKMPGLLNAVEERNMRDWALLERYVDEAQKSNQFKQFDKKLVMLMLHGATQEVFNHIEELENYYSFPECMQSCIHIVLYGITKYGNAKNGGNTAHDET